MVNKKGAGLKSLQSLLRLIQFLAALLILGIFSYFLARLAVNNLPKARYIIAVEIIAAAAVLYTLLAVLLTFFLGGFTLFGALAVLIDLAFLGAFIAVAVLTRSGKRRCRGPVSTPLGRGTVPQSPRDVDNGFGFGRDRTRTYRPNLDRACKLNRAVFITSIILLGLFLITAILQLLIVKQHKKNKRYGPSPSNGYTEGSGKKGGLFARKPKNYTRDAELATVGATTTAPVVEKPAHNQIRPSHDTAYTGSTVASPDPYGVNKYGNNQTTTGTTNPVVAAAAAGHNHNHGFTGPAPHGVGPLHNYAGTTTTTTY